MAEFMITLPDHDDLTHYCSKWSEKVVSVAEKANHNVIRVEGKDANRKNFESRVAKHKPDFVMFNGHGDEETVGGYANEPVFSCKSPVKNEKISKGRIIYARACSCGAVLGPKCIEAGCKAFVGYKMGFALIKSKGMMSRPLKDGRASPFLEVSNQIPIFILKGSSIEEAVKKADVRLGREVERLRTTDSFLASHLLPWLLWNQAVRVVLGNKSATA
jgi:hypothetical protein